MTDIVEIISAITRRAIENVNLGDWTGSPYAPLRELQADLRGQVGEEICVAILEQAGHKVEFDRNVTKNEKDYDFKCDGLRIEVKLATRGAKSKTFQHENLNRQRHFDGIVIIDVAPQKVYLACLAKEDMPWNEMHRRHSSSYYKYDLSVRKHEDAQNGIATTGDFLKKYRAMDARIRKLRE